MVTGEGPLFWNTNPAGLKMVAGAPRSFTRSKVNTFQLVSKAAVYLLDPPAENQMLIWLVAAVAFKATDILVYLPCHCTGVVA